MFGSLVYILDFKLSPCSECCFFFFWVIPRRLIYICRSFGTLYLFHLQRHLPLKMEQIECSETLAYINQTPGNHPKENKQLVYIVDLFSGIVFLILKINIF